MLQWYSPSFKLQTSVSLNCSLGVWGPVNQSTAKGKKWPKSINWCLTRIKKYTNSVNSNLANERWRSKYALCTHKHTYKCTYRSHVTGKPPSNTKEEKNQLVPDMRHWNARRSALKFQWAGKKNRVSRRLGKDWAMDRHNNTRSEDYYLTKTKTHCKTPAVPVQAEGPVWTSESCISSPTDAARETKDTTYAKKSHSFNLLQHRKSYLLLQTTR